MASYLDNIPTFNEYVEQRPQDEMLKVGLFKQQAYNQGVQKIQNSIDNIAGLDVVRPQDKEYLQSKLNALGGQLNSIAASDFSNFQLVNSVDGMTKQLVNDPVILNAVGSAAKYRKQLEQQQEITGKGKGSQSNDLFFSKQVQAWMDGDLNSTFNATYRPYVDYNKMAQDVVKGLAADTVGPNDIYATTDSRGKIVYYDAVTRRKIEALTPEKIQTALKAALPPDAYQQMAIDGQFKYNGIDDEVFSQDVNQSYNSTFLGLQKEIEDMEALQDSSKTAAEKNAIQDQIDALQRQAESLKSEYESVSSSFLNSDVETAKGQLYSTDWMKNFTNSYSYKNVSETIHTNPFRETELKVAKMQQDQANFNAKFYQTERHNAEMARLKKQENATLEVGAYGGVPINQGDDANDSQVAAAGKIAMEEAMQLTITERERLKTKYGFTDKQLQDEITRNSSNPASLPDDLRSDLSVLSRLDAEYKQISNLVTSINEDALKIYPEPPQLKAANKSITIDYDDGGIPSTYTSDYKSLISMFNSDKFQQYVYEDPDAEGPDTIFTRDYQRAMGPESELSAQEKAVFEQLFAPGYTDRGVMYGISGDSGSAVYDDIISFSESKLIQNALRNITQQREKFIAEELRKTNIIPQSVAYPIPLTNTAQKAEFDGLLGGIAIDMDKGDVDEGVFGGGGVAADIRTALEKGIISANVVTAGADGKYQLIVTDGDGNPSEIDLTQQQYERFFQGRYEPSPAVRAFNQRILPAMIDTRQPLEEFTLSNGERSFRRNPNAYYTTATDSKYKTSLENAFLSSESGDFPALKYYKASGNVVSDVNPKTENGMYRLQLNIYDPVSGRISKNILWPSMVPKEQIAPLLGQLTDEIIYELLVEPGAQMSSRQYQQLAKAAQSPNTNIDYEKFVGTDLNRDGKIGQ